MKRLILIGGSLAITAMLMSLLFPSLMRISPPEEVVPILAKQQLQEFHMYFDVFEGRHGRMPSSTEELLADGNYLRGVVEPHRTQILRSLEYPLMAHPILDTKIPVIAAYHVPEFGDFYLLSDGTVVEKRLQNNAAASYWKAQRNN